MESLFSSTGVQLLKAAVTNVGHLVFDGGLGTSHGGRWEGSGKDETRGQRANGVNHVGRTSDVTTDAAIGLAESAGNDVDSIHDGFPRPSSSGLTSRVGFKVEVLSNTGTVRSV